MGRIEKTVFISYRRTNFWIALAIFQNLNANGYDVFFDYKSIPSGDFEQVIVENVKSRAHFIIVLTPSALERCHEPGDWLRREIETAIDNKRNIIPLMLESFDFGSPATVTALTGKLVDLKKYNALGIPAEYFDEAMTKLRGEKFLSRPLESVLHPVSDTTRYITEEQKFAAREAKPVEKEQLTAQEWFERGVVFNEAKDYEEAIRCYTEAIRLEPVFLEAYGNRGNAYADKGDHDSAITDYDKVLDLDLKDEKAYYNRGDAHRNKGYLNIAIADYTEAIRLKPDQADAYSGRGNLLSAKGDDLAALIDFQKAIELQPNRGSFRGSLVRILKLLGREQEAKEQEQLAHQLIEKDDFYNRACFEAICGNNDKALELLRIALEMKQPSKEWARQDPDLENIRNDPRFKALVGI